MAASPSGSASTKFLEPSQRKFIGKGSFGSVYEGLDSESGRLVAIKEIVINSQDQDLVARVVKELKLLKSLRHPNVTQFLAAFRTEFTLHIVMEMIPGGSVSRLIKRYGKLPEAVVRRYTADMLMGLEYLHEQRVAHRDVKGENLLVASNGRVKLTDFGCSKQISQIDRPSFTTLAGTPWFMAPEVIHGKSEGFSADVWSVGCTVLEMLTGHIPFNEFTDPNVAMLAIAQKDITPAIPESVSPLGTDFLAHCLVRDPSRRATVTELLCHEYIRPYLDGEHMRRISQQQQQQQQPTPPPDAAQPHFIRGGTPPPCNTSILASSPQQHPLSTPSRDSQLSFHNAAVVGYAALEPPGPSSPMGQLSGGTVTASPPLAMSSPDPFAGRVVSSLSNSRPGSRPGSAGANYHLPALKE